MLQDRCTLCAVPKASAGGGRTQKGEPLPAPEGSRDRRQVAESPRWHLLDPMPLKLGRPKGHPLWAITAPPAGEPGTERSG